MYSGPRSMPAETPAAARIIAPVLSEVVHRVVSCTRRSQSSSCRSAVVAAVRGPEPGTSTTSGFGVSA
jgi:hypothetical protein